MLWQAAKPITTLNNQNCANILVNMSYNKFLNKINGDLNIYAQNSA